MISRAAHAETPWAKRSGVAQQNKTLAGHTLAWTGSGPGRIWNAVRPLSTQALQCGGEAGVEGRLDQHPCIVSRAAGRGRHITLAFHPGELRDQAGAGTALLRHMLVCSLQKPVVWLDLEKTMILRMDDPGGAQNIHLQTWYYPKLDEKQWAALGADLNRREASVALGYIAGWVDDGDSRRGDLHIAGQKVPRVPGNIHPSPLVDYVDRNGFAPGTRHDYRSEYRGIQALVAEGRASVELHGFTHMYPDLAAWSQADDRYENVNWFRELGRNAETVLEKRVAAEHPLALGMQMLEQHFGARATTLISPGDQWTREAIRQALHLGLHFVSSYYLAIRTGNRFCWSQHVCAPYLDEPDTAWFDSGLPVVGYFHDRELSLEGPGWMTRWLDRWQECGARRMMDYRELAALTECRFAFSETEEGLALKLENGSPFVPPRPFPVRLYVPGSPDLAAIPVLWGGQYRELVTEHTGDGFYRLVVASAERG